MTVEELAGVRDMLRFMVAEKKKELDEYSRNPPLDELLPEISRWAAEVAAAAGPQYKAEVCTGRRACDAADYKAIVVTDRGDQLGSIPLRQDRFGMLTYNIQIPSSGQYAEDFKLDVKDFKTSCIRPSKKWPVNVSSYLLAMKNAFHSRKLPGWARRLLCQLPH